MLIPRGFLSLGSVTEARTGTRVSSNTITGFVCMASSWVLLSLFQFSLKIMDGIFFHFIGHK